MSEKFTTLRLAGERYLLLARPNGVHVVSQAGENFGAWMSRESFVEARKRALAGETEGLVAVPIGECELWLRVK